MGDIGSAVVLPMDFSGCSKLISAARWLLRRTRNDRESAGSSMAIGATCGGTLP